MAAFAIHAAGAVHEKLEGDIVKEERVEDSQLREGVRLATTITVHDVVVDSTARRRLREHVVGRRGRRHGGVPVVEEPKLLDDGALDRQL